MTQICVPMLMRTKIKVIAMNGYLETRVSELCKIWFLVNFLALPVLHAGSTYILTSLLQTTLYLQCSRCHLHYWCGPLILFKSLFISSISFLCLLADTLNWPGAIDKAELRRLLWDTGYSVNRLFQDMHQRPSSNEDVAMTEIYNMQ